MFTIYSQAGFHCPHCTRAANVLRTKQLAYQTKPLERAALLAVAEKAGMTTVPIIYRDDVLIGGADDLDAYLKEQNL